MQKEKEMEKKRLYFTLIIINIVILVFFGTRIVMSHQDDVIIHDVSLYNWSGDVNSKGHFDAGLPSAKYWFIGQSGTLEPGVYHVRLYYNTNGSHYYLYCTSDTDGNRYPAVYADDYSLSSNDHSLEFTVWVNDRIENLKVVIECGRTQEIPSDSYLDIDRLEVIRGYKASVSYRMVMLLFKIMLLDLLFLIWINRDYIKRNFYVVLGLGVIFFVSSISVFTNAQSLGHDLAFHMGRIVGLAEGIRSGQLPVKIQPGWCNGYGYPTSVFYGDLLLYIPAVLYLLKIPIVYAYKTYVLLINAGTILISYYCYNRISKDKYIALGGAALYCLSMNRVSNVILRAAVGEYSAFMFLPLILLGMWELFTEEENTYKHRNSWIWLTIGMTGIIQTHTLSFEMVVLFLIIVCLIMVKKVLRPKNIVLLLRAAGITILLNVWFLIPFLDYAREELNIFLQKTDGYGIQHYGASLYELLSVVTVGAGGAIKVTGGLVGRYPASLGPAILVVILFALMLSVKAENWETGGKKEFLLIAGVSVIPIFMSTYYFPWNWLAGIKPLASVVASIQFPWRFLSIAMPLLALLFCMILMKLRSDGKERLMREMLILVSAIAVYSSLQYTDLIVRNNINYTKYDGDHLFDIREIISGAEYLYQDTDLTMVLTDGEASGEGAYVENLRKNGTQMEIGCVADAGGCLEVPLFAYPYYECRDQQTGQEYTIVRGNNNKIRIDFNEAYEGTLEIKFKEPWYWRAAELVSLISLVEFVLLVIRSNKKKNYVV